MSLPSHHRSKSFHTAHDFWKHFQQRPLDAIFRPRSVALIGASEKEGSVGRTILWNLVSSPFGGTIYPVNNNKQNRDNIFGIRSYRNVQHIPEDAIDLAIIAVPSTVVKDVMQDCVNASVKCAIIISAGFKETGTEGAILENEIMDIARDGNIRVIGPNCLGVIVRMYQYLLLFHCKYCSIIIHQFYNLLESDQWVECNVCHKHCQARKCRIYQPKWSHVYVHPRLESSGECWIFRIHQYWLHDGCELGRYHILLRR
mmetsp:Transcript_25328/g.45806  ORF Transcript_25328/g.45806 Transcript_25328/m.45806 type:complete len:257 (+) Transcript_25328:66-836(+)